MIASLAQMVRQLQQHRVRFIVIGGWAAIIHGTARSTNDVDVVYARDAENIERLAQALTPWHPYFRGAPPGCAVAAGDASGGSFALARFTADTALPTANQRFVAQAYLDLLGRPVDGAGLAQWTGLLDRGTSRAEVALDIEFSPEYTGRRVNALYAQYLHRSADPGGLSNSVNFLRSGGTIEQLIDILVSSPEFIQGQGKGSADGFLDALYLDALDRAVDPGGRAGWKQALANGASFAQVAAAILASAEYRQAIVMAAYELFLHRQSDTGGLNGFTAALGQGARDEQVFAVIVGSQEYFQRIQGVA
jgi:hypothetical protein